MCVKVNTHTHTLTLDMNKNERLHLAGVKKPFGDLI